MNGRTRRALVIGGGISGLAAAVDLVDQTVGDPATDGHSVNGQVFDTVEVWEAADRLGGKIATSPFASLPHVDEGADAFLRRVPAALEFTRRIGINDGLLVAPEPVGAAVFHDKLHDIPDGVLLGVPAAVWPFVTTDLLSWRGKARAALEPFVPRTDPDDSLGALVRRRFGNEVHDRLVDALVGSIYATDTDRSSLQAVPQLGQLAAEHRSLLLGARTVRRGRSSAAASGPIFAAHPSGSGAIVAAAAEYLTSRGATIHTNRPVTSIEADGSGWRVNDERFDAIVVATPGGVAAQLLASVAPDAAAGLATTETADVIMVRLAVPGSTWPERLRGRSGYLVAKTQQRFVTAASFGSQKWAHWQPADGDQILRVSLGRDGLPVAMLTDDEVVNATVDEVSGHLGFQLEPNEISITRWIGAFPQYRPHHHERVAALEHALPGTLALCGASYRGIGVPACISDGQRAAKKLNALELGTS